MDKNKIDAVYFSNISNMVHGLSLSIRRSDYEDINGYRDLDILYDRLIDYSFQFAKNGHMYGIFHIEELLPTDILILNDKFENNGFKTENRKLGAYKNIITFKVEWSRSNLYSNNKNGDE